MNREIVAKKLLKMAKELVSEDGWPEDVEEGGLRSAMGLDENVPLSEQADPSAVIDFFNDADAEGRGMVMFAVNSNPDSDFWQEVGEGISE